MDKYGDWLIMAIAGVLVSIWLYGAFYRWLHAPATMNKVKLGKGGAIAEDDEHVQLLERNGYRVVSGKHVIPIPVELDDAPLGKGTRIFIDYIAEMDHLTYIVKTARERMPMDWTASGLRDRLLIYALLLPDCAGVLYVDPKGNLIRKITFDIAD
ncbi:hypothetical protein D3P07_06970 [Paenibacillus sp. 1011MAR3C5]|uniref:hypothetical protein n=1 Tax=Paenibacillus sp. 1011MAR3C5 TaxID=1675787 RepID=UPI000E6D27BB|nr:hypothetical protein [Paenibacillus sp. 1011MAR3C5]RJE90490.1 hypothetical protein D3P07_06970 [Paenibacillus sp. 1011MAR3C5]